MDEQQQQQELQPFDEKLPTDEAEAEISMLGRRLRVARVARAMTLWDSAKRVGMTAQALSKIERGHMVPNVTRLTQLAQLYRVSRNWLLSEEPIELG